MRIGSYRVEVMIRNIFNVLDENNELSIFLIYVVGVGVNKDLRIIDDNG